MKPPIIASTIFEFLNNEGWTGETINFVLVLLLHALLLVIFFHLVPGVAVWAERKVSARIQDRLGPTRPGGKFGWLVGLADGIKLIQKEDLCPKDADRFLFRLAPYLVCIASFAAFIVLPFSDGWVAVASDVGIFVLFAILSLEVFGIVLAGWSSGSKWSLFGGIRESAQMVSYEIPLAIGGLVPIVALGTLNLGEIGNAQSGWIFNWMIFHDPFCFIAFFVYFTVVVAGCKRAPFDLAEAESELVGGFHTEYSGMRWLFFYMAEYSTMYLLSAVAAILFLGGWHTGIGPVDGFLIGLRESSTSEGFVASSYLANLIGMSVILTKGALLLIVQIWVRWTLPRLRIDQVMMTCLKYLLPLTCALFLGAILWPLIMIQITGRPVLFGASVPLGDRVFQTKQTQPKSRTAVTHGIQNLKTNPLLTKDVGQ